MLPTRCAFTPPPPLRRLLTAYKNSYKKLEAKWLHVFVFAQCALCFWCLWARLFPRRFPCLAHTGAARNGGDAGTRERAREERPYVVPEYTIATGGHQEKETGKSATGK